MNKVIRRWLKTKKAFPTGNAAAKPACLAAKTYESGDSTVRAASPWKFGWLQCLKSKRCPTVSESRMVRIQMRRLSDALAVKVPPLVEFEEKRATIEQKIFQKNPSDSLRIDVRTDP